MTRNPKWTREEMILALDLYHRIDPLRVSVNHPEIRRLSLQLRSFPFHPPQTRASTFRNPTGILMTLRTLMRYDPARGMRGLQGGRLGHDLWVEFHNRGAELHQLAVSIVAAGGVLQDTDSTANEYYEEGGVLLRLHRLRERNQRLVDRKKAMALRETGSLACEACGFDFARIYGSVGEGFIECHHRKPLHELSVRGRVHLDQLALVCANCHRMLHRKDSLITVEQLKTFLPQRK